MHMNLEVETDAGTVRGTRHDGTLSFKGIPFAAAPVGELRFAAPAPAPSWTGVRDATGYGPISPQHLDPLSAMIAGCEWNYYHPAAVADEDCLNLNVWVPDTDREAPRAVYVWIHGGAFLAGSGTGLWCDGSSLAAQEDIIVVTVNYRLGALGGLAPEQGEVSGNNFVLDQIAALRWVRDNIAAFGGDPDQVTIGGESAGAMSVVTLMSSPAARGLFRAAIVQSGHGALIGDQDHARNVGRRYLSQLDLPEQDRLTALRSVELSTLMDAQERLTGEVMVPFRPVVDGQVLPAEPLELFRAGAQAAVPLLIGINTDENNLLTVMGMGPGQMRDDLPTRIAELFDDPKPEVLAELVELYRGLEPTDVDAWNTLTSDRDWRSPVRDLSDAHADSGAPVFSYEFTYRSPVMGGALRACHALEIPFSFGNLAQRGVSEFVGDDEQLQPVREAAERAFVQAWGSFIRTGRPVSTELPDWPEYRSGQRNVMRIGADPGVSVDPAGSRLDRWQELAPQWRLLEL